MVTRMPRSLSASRVAPRAMKVTSSPACASCAPTNPPIAPAPMMAVFISTSDCRIADCAAIDFDSIDPLDHAGYLRGGGLRRQQRLGVPGIAAERHDAAVGPHRDVARIEHLVGG